MIELANIALEAVELGVLARVNGDATSPGVVLVHDVWGMAEHPRHLARRLAAEGFRVLAVDLYRELGHFEISDPAAWIQDLDDRRVLADLESAARYLRATAQGAPAPRVGVVGFCMGGMYTLLAACLSSEFAASVPFYGLLSHRHGLLWREGGLDPVRKPNEPLAVAAKLRCPLLGFFGAEDALIPPADVAQLERAFARAASRAEVVVVAGAGHAFMNDTRADAYRPEAAARAWQRSVAFLRAELAN